jgi:hypothetical protein
MRLALLIASPKVGEVAMHNDLLAIYNALTQRGLSPEEIQTLDDVSSRDTLMTFLSVASTQVARWKAGDLFVFFSGHGAFWPWDAAEPSNARPALWLGGSGETPDDWAFWDELFAALQVPADVLLTLLADC